MKLQPASKREVKRIAIGTGICAIIMIAVLFVLSLVGIGTFGYPVFVGAACGCAIAIFNFTLLCLTIQKASGMDDQRMMKTRIQASYNGRLLLQAGWILAAYLIPHTNTIAAAVPLLFPNLVIYYLQSRGKLVSPSDRTDAPADLPEDDEDPLGPFEV